MPERARDALRPEGILARAVTGFQPRVQQQVMAAAVAEVLEQPRSALLIEAATGVGKTYAYLVPALLSQRRILISTGTKTLQDQLFEKDLPVVCQALNRHPKAALLKGRSNYLCHYRLDAAAGDGAGGRQGPILEALQRFARRSADGDLTQAEILAENAPLWSQVTSTVDNCLGHECPRLNECFVVRARRRAQDADVIVVNHHLLLADMALKDEGFGELLPQADAVIVDEAHQLPEIAGAFFGLALGTRALRDLGRDIVRDFEREAPDLADLREPVASLQEAVAGLLECSRDWPARAAWSEISGGSEVAAALSRLDEALEQLGTDLAAAAGRTPGLDQARARCLTLRSRLQEWRADDTETVAWVERFRQSLILHRTPLDAARPLAQQREACPASWVFTSATLAIGDDFNHAARRLGLPADVRTERLDSPFDFSRQACLVLPERPLPNPNSPGYTRACIDWAWPLVEGSPGGGFFLFTSHRALQEAAGLLRDRLPSERVLLVQGEQPRAELLARFRASGQAWLLGAQSFWEGVDIRGDALSTVIIDRLPFAAPNDPVLQARVATIEAAGGSAFMDFQLPQAVLALKQGAGRLIRDAQDSGILALCDPRILQKPYGRRFFDGLPAFHQTRDPLQALAFLRAARERSREPAACA
ncbi:ATP-dependent DNA helicase [Thioalkalivibrio paradoxus]|uniref:Helicase n=1 Tax=Thioalkalivibrio paradoxus ARh 1 TaxID=713585 RepID=W0DNS5_9GAMM|nr:ATP-dependent DNA helicase [Thioalkalivibrio paradoxus]AHE98902.1 helicase [Thioalkalivibrio paradoxus ARh 1]